MTEIAICGSGGLLGRALCERASARSLTVRPLSWQAVLDGERFDLDGLRALINAAGLTPARAEVYPFELVESNAVLPHFLHSMARPYGLPFIQVSTDCVYGGDPVSTQHPPKPPEFPHGTSAVRPVSLYARTKLAGECGIAVRTSFVGPGAGLWEDIRQNLSAGLTYPGWSNVWWSGGHVLDVADALLDIALDPPPEGVYNLATADPINKFGLSRLIALCSEFDPLTVYEFPWMYGDRTMQPDFYLPPCRLGRTFVLPPGFNELDARRLVK